MAGADDTPQQSPTDAEDHDETMGDQSEEEDEDNTTETNGHHEDPQTPTDYSLFSNPPNVASTRQRLFDVGEPIEMSSADWQMYWPYMDNVWRRIRSGEGVSTSEDGQAEYYWCKLRKPPGAKPHIPRPTPEGKQARRRRVKDDLSCNMAMKVVYNSGPNQTVTILRNVEPNVRHTHDLDYMDSQKRNGAVMDIARRECVRAFLPTSVWWKMCQERDKLDAAGGKFMKVSDVRNVQYPWRQENMSASLKAHTGFTSARSLRGPSTKTKRQSPQQTKPLENHPQHMGPIQAALFQSLPTQPPPMQQPPPPTQQAPPPQDTLQYPDRARQFLLSYLPDQRSISARQRPHITLTWASSLDGRIAIAPGQRTALSGPETKAMTHFLRSQHDAILIGVSTATADDPSLNCRLSGAGGYGGSGDLYQPRPIIIDPHARLHIRPEMKILQVVEQGRAKAPWIIVAPGINIHPLAVQTLKAHGGEYLMINDYQPQRGFGWEGIFNVLYKEGIKSIMIEGGGKVLSNLLQPQQSHLIDSIIMTLAPVFLGEMGVQVSQDSRSGPSGKLVPTQLNNVIWQAMGEKDVVMCGRVQPEQHSGMNGTVSAPDDFAKASHIEPSSHQHPMQPNHVGAR